MAFTLINPVNALWQRRGLSCLLMPEGFNAFAARQTCEAHLEPANQATGEKQHRPPRPLAKTSAIPRAAQAKTPTTAPAFGKTVAAQEPRRPDLWHPLPPHAWPEPWRGRLKQTRPGLVLWTYWNLGPDLSDPQVQGRKERRVFLQRLLQDLGHPAGTHTFWPACLPQGPEAPPSSLTTEHDGYAANQDVFWSGVHQLKARGVVVMGSAAATAVGLQGGLRPPQQIRHRGRLIWVLWDVDNLLHFEQRYASMLAFLRQGMIPVLR